MTAWKLAIIVFSVWALIRFWIHPALEKRWISSSLPNKVTRAGSLAAIEMLRNLLLRVGIVLLLVLLIIVVGNLLGGTEAIFPKALIGAIADSAAAFKTFKDLTSSAVVVATLLIAAVILYRTAKNAKSRMREKILDRIEKTRLSLQSDTERDTVLAADPAFGAEFQQILALHQQRDQLKANRPSAQQEIVSLDSAISERIHNLILTIALSKFDPVEELKSAPHSDEAEASPDAEQSKPVGTRQKPGTILTSAGLARDLGFVKSGLDRVATGVLVLSLLSWTSESLADSFRLAATNLQVSFDRANVTRSYDHAIEKAEATKIPPIPAPTATVARVSQTIARQIVQEIVQADFQRAVGLNIQTPKSYEDDAIRAAVLETKVTPAETAAGEDVLRAASLSTDIEQRGVNQGAEALAAQLHTKIQPLVEEINKRDPGAFAKLSEAVEKHFREPLGIWDAQEKIIGNALSQALGSVDLPMSSELANQGKELTREFGKKALSKWVDTKIQSFVANAILTDVLQEPAAAYAGMHLNNSLKDDTLHTLAQVSRPEGTDSYGWHTVRTATITNEGAAADEIAASLRSAGNVPAAVRDSLMGYDAIFPSANRMMAGVESEGASRVFAAAAQGAARMSANFFAAARGGLARGVIFGREPVAGHTALQDIRWRIKEGVVGVDVQPTGSANWISIGEFDAGVANQAVRFAADQRVVAVTLTSGRPVARLGIHLNPELVDTPLGCRVVQLDRFIDTLDKEIPRVAADREAIGNFVEAYNMAALKPAKQCKADPEERSSLDRGLLSGRHVPPDFVKNLRDGLKTEPASLNVVSESLDCLERGSGAQMRSCLCAPTKDKALASKPVYIVNDLTSQVRERAYSLDPDLRWMSRSANGLGAMEFWLHVTLEKVQLDGQEIGPRDGSTTIAVAFGDADLSELNKAMPNLIRPYVNRNKGVAVSYDSYIQPIEEFVLLQRFFRAALSSELGPNFPRQKLVEFERSTRSQRKHHDTIRWQVENEEEAKMLEEVSKAEFVKWREYERNNQHDFCDAA